MLGEIGWGRSHGQAARTTKTATTMNSANVVSAPYQCCGQLPCLRADLAAQGAGKLDTEAVESVEPGADLIDIALDPEPPFVVGHGD